jgi:hypothetical protein
MYLGEHLFAEQMLKEYFTHPESTISSIEETPPNKRADIVIDSTGRRVEHVWARVKPGGIYVLQNPIDAGFAICCAHDLLRPKKESGELDYESVTFYRGRIIIEKKMRAYKK